MKLTAAQIYAFARAAGFPPVVAVTMTAIALRESGGDPEAFNNNESTGDYSFGLWQINMLNAGIRTLIVKSVIPPPPNNGFYMLLDPARNARAAFALWAGENKNLDVAWYIDRGTYKTRYEAHLPEAQAAALAYVEQGTMVTIPVQQLGMLVTAGQPFTPAKI